MGGNVASVFSAFAGYERAMYWVIPLGISLHIANYLFGKIRHQPFAERIFDRMSLRFPVASRLARMRAMASFTRVLRRLLMSGVSPSPAFSGAASAVPNGVLRDQLRLGEPIVRGGQGLDEAIMATGLMAHDPLQMLVTGQKTGQWIEMLDQVTAYYQDEAARATDGAKAAQRRLGVLLTIVVTGYITCFSTWLGYKLVFQVTDQMAS
jgi:type II secretory pathway component PulF